MTRPALWLSFSLFVGAPAILAADTITFEGFGDSTILTNQYAGLTFTNAIILSSGISLNEVDFPPRSGSNIVSDFTGPMSLSFSTPVSSFSGYFTYTEPLTLEAFDAANTLLASATSAFSENFASCSGPGCDPSPNEFIQVSAATGISEITITGDPLGGSFTLDNATLTPLSTPAVPEPSSWFLLFSAGSILAIVQGRKKAE